MESRKMQEKWQIIVIRCIILCSFLSIIGKNVKISTISITHMVQILQHTILILMPTFWLIVLHELWSRLLESWLCQYAQFLCHQQSRLINWFSLNIVTLQGFTLNNIIWIQTIRTCARYLTILVYESCLHFLISNRAELHSGYGTRLRSIVNWKTLSRLILIWPA